MGSGAMRDTSAPITHLLDAVGRGDPDARERLLDAVYGTLRVIAAHQMAAEAPCRTLQPTALVHEAYLKLFGSADAPFANRKHFFAAAARAMRQIRTDDARRRKRLKRGGDAGRAGPTDAGPTDGGPTDGNPGARADGKAQDLRPSSPRQRVHTEPAVFDDDPVELLAIDEALARLDQIAPRQARIVELRYYGGFTIDETAEALGVSPRTVDADWLVARAWLHRELAE